MVKKLQALKCQSEKTFGPLFGVPFVDVLTDLYQGCKQENDNIDQEYKSDFEGWKASIQACVAGVATEVCETVSMMSKQTRRIDLSV
jgi:hypothetical protein